MGKWVTIRLSDIAWEPPPTGPHRGKLCTIISRLVCKRCGLTRLRNKPSERAWRDGCGWREKAKQRAR